jgi:hypothetical protein
MSGTVEKDESFSHSVIDAFKRGSKKGISASNLFERFGLTSNPFDTNTLIGNPDLVTEETKIVVNKLAERIGACYHSQKSLLVIGAEGSGRTSILKLLNATLNIGFDKNFSTYIHAPTTWSGFLFKDQRGQQQQEQEDGGCQDSDDDRVIDAFQKWMTESDFSTTKIILIDDADAFSSKIGQYTNAIKFEHLQVPTMVFCISPLTQSHITKSELFNEIFADAFWMITSDKDNIKQIILKSIEAVKTTTFSPFDDSAIDTIADYSLGLPGQAARLALLSLKDAYQIGINTINAKLVERVASNQGYDVARKITRKEIKLDGTKYNIALEILTQFLIQGRNVERTFIISRFSDMATSTLSYHLKDLINTGVIKQERIGYKVFYVMPRPVRTALEIMTLPSLEAGLDN